jgi:hypothetical protein
MPKTRPAATATRHVVVYFLNDSSIQRQDNSRSDSQVTAATTGKHSVY